MYSIVSLYNVHQQQLYVIASYEGTVPTKSMVHGTAKLKTFCPVSGPRVTVLLQMIRQSSLRPKRLDQSVHRQTDRVTRGPETGQKVLSLAVPCTILLVATVP